MPTYEYICEKCGQRFEKYQSISAEPLSVCSKDVCGQKPWGKGKVKRAISGGAGLIFKGSGFYTTDYRSEKYKEAARKDSPQTPATSTTPAAADSKGASKAGEGGKKPSPVSK